MSTKKKSPATRAVAEKKAYDINNIAAICQILGYSELTVMNFKMFKGLPMEFIKGNWRAKRKEVLKWNNERE